MAHAVHEDPLPAANPLDAVEQVTLANGWPFERHGEEEIVVEIEGKDCTHRLWFAWHAGRETLHLTCAFDMKVPEARRSPIFPLLAAVNERLWIGHFDLFREEGMIAFRHAVLLRGGPGVSLEQLGELIDVALGQCEQYYPVFQYVIWGGMTPAEAMTAALLETVGEA